MDGAQAGQKLAGGLAEGLDGLIAVTDPLANGIIAQLHTSTRLRVPDDIAVVGLENNRSASGFTIPLTAIDPPARRMGQESVRLLLDEIREPSAHRHAAITLEPQLIVRASAPGPA
jgi:LacI family transcriptional regulator